MSMTNETEPLKEISVKEEFLQYVSAHVKLVESGEDQTGEYKFGSYTLDVKDSLVPINGVIFGIYANENEIETEYYIKLVNDNITVYSVFFELAQFDYPERFLVGIGELGDDDIEVDTELLADQLLSKLIELDAMGLILPKK